MEDVQMFDARGYRRSRATMPGFNIGRPPRNRGVALDPAGTLNPGVVLGTFTNQKAHVQ